MVIQVSAATAAAAAAMTNRTDASSNPFKAVMTTP
jgi:hypothetical protein